MKNLLVIEVGGTWIRIGRFHGRRLMRWEKLSTPRPWSAARRQLVAATGRLFPGIKVQQVVMGLPGVLDRAGTKLVQAPNLKDWQRATIKADLKRIYRAPVTLVNDAALGALGEATSGAGRGYNIVAYLAIGTGIGGARVVSGRIDQTAVGFEPGHQIVDQGRTLEELIGGRALERRFQSNWDSLTKKDWASIAEWLAIGLVNITNLWSPEVIVLSGSIVHRGKMSLPQIRSYLRRWLRTVPPPRIVKGVLGDQAGLRGGSRYLPKS